MDNYASHLRSSGQKPTFGSQELFAILMELEEDQKGQSIHTTGTSL